MESGGRGSIYVGATAERETSTMKPIKAFVLVAMMSLIATAFVSTGSAMAEGSVLCSADENPCANGNRVEHTHLVSKEKILILTPPFIVECDVLFLGEVEYFLLFYWKTGNYTYTNCNSGCTVTEEGGPTELQGSRTGHETASVTGEGEFHINCTGLNCYYNLEGLEGTAKGPLLSTAANGEVKMQEQELHKVKGIFCPSNAKLSFTLVPLAATYITT